MSRVCAVLREPEYSPGRVADDAAILEAVAAALAARGVAVEVGDHGRLVGPAPDAVLAMCQSPAALAALDRLPPGVPVMNAPAAIRACFRANTVRLLTAAGAPFPATRMVATADAAGANLAGLLPGWVKRGDVHAMDADDVRFAATAADARAALAALAVRGIAAAAVQAHVPGPVVKFYGTADGRFFRCYTTDGDPPAPLAALWGAASAGARALGLDVFGGDLVIGADRRPLLVDVNDWPSFARCRADAAAAIAAYVGDRLGAPAGTVATPFSPHS